MQPSRRRALRPTDGSRHSSFCFLQQVTLRSVIRASLWRTLRRIAITAAARQFQYQAPAGRNMLPALGTKAGAVVKTYNSGRAIFAPSATLGRVANTVEHGREVEFMAFHRRNLDHLPESAAIFAVASGAGSQLLAPDDDGAGVFGGLDGHGVNAGRERRCGQPVLIGPRAHAAGVEHQ